MAGIANLLRTHPQKVQIDMEELAYRRLSSWLSTKVKVQRSSSRLQRIIWLRLLLIEGTSSTGSSIMQCHAIRFVS